MSEKLVVVYNSDVGFSKKSKIALGKFIGKIRVVECKQFLNVHFYVNGRLWKGDDFLIKRYEEPNEGEGYLYFILSNHEECHIFRRSDIAFLNSTLPGLPSFNTLDELKLRLEI